MKHIRIFLLISMLLTGAKYCASSCVTPAALPHKATISIKKFTKDLPGCELAHDIWNNNSTGSAYHFAGKQKTVPAVIGGGFCGNLGRAACAGTLADRLPASGAIAARNKTRLLFPMHSFL